VVLGLLIAALWPAAAAAQGSAWTNVTPADPAPSPPARRSASMATDPTTGKVVLFGGYNGGFLNDTWTWGGDTWTNATPASPAPSPPARLVASMATDPTTGEVVLFGGNGGSHFLNDTWTWDGSAWTNATPASPAPSPSARYAASMATDPTTGEVVLFGGTDRNGGILNDTWTWDGSAWTKATPAAPAPSPPARYGASMATDPTTGEVVLFGGTDRSDFSDILNDTWTWDGSAWTNATPASPAPSPTARWAASMASDPTSGEVVLLGGVDSSGDILNDTWTWDGTPDNDAPTNISLTNSSIAENAPQGTDVGELSSTDPDVPIQTFTYTLVTGTGDTDNKDFQINGSTLEVKNPLDFEAGATRTVRIRTTDNGSPNQSFEKRFTITVTDVNEAGPTDPTTPTDPNPPTGPDQPVVPGAPPAPETTIGHFPANPKRAHTHFRFRSSIPGSTFTCRLDKEKSEACESPQDYRDLEPGHHVFRVFATSPQGVSDPTPAKARFRIVGSGQ
jgi:hypothetical protein